MSVEKIKKLYGISDEFIDLLVGVNKLKLGLSINKRLNLGFNVIISVLVDDYRYTKRKFGFDVPDEVLEKLLEYVSKEKICRDAVRFILERLAMHQASSVDDAISKYGLQKVNRKKLEEEISKLIKSSQAPRLDTLIPNLKDKLGFTFDFKEAYEIASQVLKNG